MVLLTLKPPSRVDEEFQELLSDENPIITKPENPLDSSLAQISLHALMGHLVPQTLAVLGQIGKAQLSILINSGNTQNFLQERLVKFLNLDIIPAQGFSVQVGNGEELQCSKLCKEVQIHIGPHLFTEDLFVLPITGANLVPGV